MVVRYVQYLSKCGTTMHSCPSSQDQRKGRTERSSVKGTEEVMTKETGTEKKAGKDVRYLRPD